MPNGDKLKIFVSSKIEELKDERTIIKEVIERLNYEPIMSEEWIAKNEDIKRTHLQRVRDCNIYIGIFYIEFSKSVKEEYEEAEKFGKDILIYVKIPKDRKRNKETEEFIAKIRNKHTFKEFDKANELKEKVSDSINKLLSRKCISIIKQMRYKTLVDKNISSRIVKICMDRNFSEFLTMQKEISETLIEDIAFKILSPEQKELLFLLEEKEREYCEQTGKFVMDCEFYISLAKIEFDIGEYDKANEYYDKCSEVGKITQNEDLVKIGEGNKARIYMMRGEIEKALSIYKDVLNYFTDKGDKRNSAGIYHQIATTYQLRKDYENALVLYDESLRINEELGNKRGIAQTKHNIAMIYQDKWEYDNSLKFYEESLKIFEELGDKIGVANTKQNIANIYKLKGDIENTLKLYNEILNLKEQLGDRLGIALTLEQIGIIYYEQKNYEKSIENLLTSLSILKDLQSADGDIVRNYLTKIKKELGEGKFNAIVEKFRKDRIH